MTTARRRALAGLALLLPLASIGTASAVVLFPGTALGVGVFLLCKAGLLAIPVVWHVTIESRSLKWPRPSRHGMAAGAGSGLAIAAAIIVAYVTVGPALVDPERLRRAVTAAGLGSPARYVAGAAYWTFANALLEEYVWRWFVTRQFGRVLRPSFAVGASAAAFTAHHVIVLAVYMPPLAAGLCSLGVAVGGAVWSVMYLRYRSVWPGYVSHVIVDAAIFAIGFALIFG